MGMLPRCFPSAHNWALHARDDRHTQGTPPIRPFGAPNPYNAARSPAPAPGGGYRRSRTRRPRGRCPLAYAEDTCTNAPQRRMRAARSSTWRVPCARAPARRRGRPGGQCGRSLAARAATEGDRTSAAVSAASGSGHHMRRLHKNVASNPSTPECNSCKGTRALLVACTGILPVLVYVHMHRVHSCTTAPAASAPCSWSRGAPAPARRTRCWPRSAGRRPRRRPAQPPPLRPRPGRAPPGRRGARRLSAAARRPPGAPWRERGLAVSRALARAIRCAAPQRHGADQLAHPHDMTQCELTILRPFPRTAMHVLGAAQQQFPSVQSCHEVITRSQVFTRQGLLAPPSVPHAVHRRFARAGRRALAAAAHHSSRKSGPDSTRARRARASRPRRGRRST